MFLESEVNKIFRKNCIYCYCNLHIALKLLENLVFFNRMHTMWFIRYVSLEQYRKFSFFNTLFYRTFLQSKTCRTFKKLSHVKLCDTNIM